MPSMREVAGFADRFCGPADKLTLKLLPAFIPAPLFRMILLPEVRLNAVRAPGTLKSQTVLIWMLSSACSAICEYGASEPKLKFGLEDETSVAFPENVMSYGLNKMANRFPNMEF